MIQEDLKGIGLTDGESKAFLALFDLGSSTVGPIVKKTGISYSKVYEVLERLIEKGLASYTIKEKTKYFQAVEPKRLYYYLEKKENEIEKNRKKLNEIVPQLETLHRSFVGEDAQIFSGFNGIRTAYLELYKQAKKGDVSLFFYPYEVASSKEVDNFYLKLAKEINVRGIIFKGITPRDYKNSVVVKKSALKQEIRYVNYPLPGSIDIFKERVLFIAWKSKPLGVLIRSQEISENYANYFDQVWKKAKQ